MQIRRLIAADALAYWETRNRGLMEFPEAFTTSHEEGLATSPVKLAKRFGGLESDDFVLGAFTPGGMLAGYAGLQRETRVKNRHKGTIVGMYVVAEFRGGGTGRRLLDALIADARTLPGLEQLNLSVTQANDGARNLYLRAGFITYGLETDAIKVAGVYYAKEYLSLRL